MKMMKHVLSKLYINIYKLKIYTFKYSHHILFHSKEHKKLLHQKYIGIVGKPKWAKITKEHPKTVSHDDNEDEDLDLLKVNIIKLSL